jgi:hypothetical protein
MGANGAPLLADLYFYSYEEGTSKERRKEAKHIL